MSFLMFTVNSSSDLISRMISRVEALQNIYLRVYYPPVVIGLTALVPVIWFGVHFNQPCAIDYG